LQRATNATDSGHVSPTDGVEEQEFLLQVVEDYRKKIDVTKKSGLPVC
jgi:hypothetical protein